MEKANLNRQVFDKSKFQNTVDTSFSELGNTNQQDPSFFDVNLATVEDFFNLYNQLFFEIPQRGNINSHEYLIQKSSDYINFEATQAEIQALLDEITVLREENLQLRQEQIEIISQFASPQPLPAPTVGK